jgi:hypothetical protein
VNTILRHRDVNSVHSGSLLPTFWKQEVHSEWVNQLPSKLSNSLSDCTTCDKDSKLHSFCCENKETHISMNLYTIISMFPYRLEQIFGARYRYTC